MGVLRASEIVWEGDLRSGRGVVSAKSSAAFQRLPVTWASRAESPDGKTSPEELLAAAHASCFAMALSLELAKAGTPPQRLDVTSIVAFDKTASGYRVVSSELEVRGAVEGTDAQRFAALAEAAKEGCPVSQALKGNVTIGLRTTLEPQHEPAQL